MKQGIFTVMGAVTIAFATVNGQETSPIRPSATKQALKPSEHPSRVVSQPEARAAPTPTRQLGNEKTSKNERANHNNNGNGSKYVDAQKRYRHERHDREWWKRHYIVIVFVGGGYYYWDSGYWCPAWGYDPNHESYDYDGPIYSYGSLLPDQVVINVQHALKERGYYEGNVTGSLGPETRRALMSYQDENDLDITGAVDEPTVRSLGLIDG